MNADVARCVRLALLEIVDEACDAYVALDSDERSAVLNQLCPDLDRDLPDLSVITALIRAESDVELSRLRARWRFPMSAAQMVDLEWLCVRLDWRNHPRIVN